MEDIIFGTLASDELKVASLRARVQGIQHRYDLTPADPRPGQAITLTVSTGPDLPLTQVVCYYTTDGTMPQGRRGVAQHGDVQRLVPHHVTWDNLAWGYVQFWQVTLPPQPAGTLLRYQIGGWTGHDDAEYWADWPSVQEASEAATTAFFAGQPVDAAVAQARDRTLARGSQPTTFALRIDELVPPPWTRGALVYQVFLDRFYPGDGQPWLAPARSDGAPDLGGFWGGTLRGVCDRLDYLASLSVDCLWLSPLFTSPSHHGYDAVDYYTIDPRLGTADDLHDLVRGAHARGMRVLLDYATNHLSAGHPIFQAALLDARSPYREWFFFDDSAIGYRTFFNVPGMPQINTEHPAARRFLIDIATYWLREFDLDGYRLDFAHGPARSFWSDFWPACKAVKPDCWCFGEVIEPPDLQLSFVGRLDGLLDFQLNERLRRLFAQRRSDLNQFDQFLAAHEAFFPADFTRPVFLDNHDMDRFLYLAGGDVRRLQLAGLCLATLGQPWIIYAGTELAVTQDAGRDAWGLEANRVPMPWEELDNPVRAATLACFRAIGQLRRRFPWLAGGSRQTVHLDTAHGTYAYVRRSAGSPELLVAFNLGDEPQTFDISFDPVRPTAIEPVPGVASMGAVMFDTQATRITLPALSGGAWVVNRTTEESASPDADSSVVSQAAPGGAALLA